MGGQQGHLARQMCHRSKSETFALALNLAGGDASSAEDSSLTRSRSTTPRQTPSKPARRSASTPLSNDLRCSPLHRCAGMIQPSSP